MTEYFPEPKYLGRRVKVELNLSNYATKIDLKGVDTSYFATKTVFAYWKSNVDKLDIDKLKNVSTNLNNLRSKADKLDINNLVLVSVDLGQLGNVVKNEVV